MISPPPLHTVCAVLHLREGKHAARHGQALEFQFCITQTYPAEKCVHIVNPLSQDLNVMRQTLLLNGLEVVAYNLNRQATSLKFFEYGSVYQRRPETDGTTLAGYEEHRCFSLFISGTPDKEWRNPAQKSNFFLLKGYVEALMARYRIDVNTLATGAAPSDIFSEGITYSLPPNCISIRACPAILRCRSPQKCWRK